LEEHDEMILPLGVVVIMRQDSCHFFLHWTLHDPRDMLRSGRTINPAYLCIVYILFYRF